MLNPAHIRTPLKSMGGRHLPSPEFAENTPRENPRASLDDLPPKTRREVATAFRLAVSNVLVGVNRIGVHPTHLPAHVTQALDAAQKLAAYAELWDPGSGEASQTITTKELKS